MTDTYYSHTLCLPLGKSVLKLSCKQWPIFIPPEEIFACHFYLRNLAIDFPPRPAFPCRFALVIVILTVNFVSQATCFCSFNKPSSSWLTLFWYREGKLYLMPLLPDLYIAMRKCDIFRVFILYIVFLLFYLHGICYSRRCS